MFTSSGSTGGRGGDAKTIISFGDIINFADRTLFDRTLHQFFNILHIQLIGQFKLVKLKQCIYEY